MEIEIGSEEWKKARRRLITATDAPIIMGVSPWKKADQLLYEKHMAVETPINSSMQRGMDLEEEARKLFELEMGTFVYPKFIIGDPPLDWIAASFDGINDDGIAVEIKCINIKSHTASVEKGLIPAHYFVQMQHQMTVKRLKSMYYMSYHPDHKTKTCIIPVELDEKYVEEMLEEERKFYDRLMEM